MNTLITDFLEFAKPKDNKQEEFSLLDVVQEVTEAIESRQTAARTTSFSILIPREIKIFASRERIKQVLFNLFLNSVEAAAGRPISITVLAEKQDNHEVKFWVQDTGPGIPPDITNRIFDPFFTTKKNGTGLGLATVAQILKASKGRIQLVPTPSGACFEISVPAAGDLSLNETAS